jgi:hypothetical protein
MEELSRRVSSAIFGTAFYEFCIQSSISLNCYAKHLRVSVLQLICIEVTYSKQESVELERDGLSIWLMAKLLDDAINKEGQTLSKSAIHGFIECQLKPG